MFKIFLKIKKLIVEIVDKYNHKQFLKYLKKCCISLEYIKREVKYCSFREQCPRSEYSFKKSFEIKYE